MDAQQPAVRYDGDVPMACRGDSLDGLAASRGQLMPRFTAGDHKIFVPAEPAFEFARKFSPPVRSADDPETHRR